jgi:tripartite-type tricarboxylate transporter receptor subunit TctC
MGDGRVTKFLAAACVAAAFAAPAPLLAQEYPAKPVRMIVGFPPGGATDLVARIIQPKLAAGLGRQVIVDNRPGANGVISNELLARADPDGYTIAFGHIGTLVISPTIQKVPYDKDRDFAPIGLVVSLQNIIIVHPTLPAKDLKEFLAIAKAKAPLNYATSGIGSPGHLAVALLEARTGVKMSHIPYKGGGPAVTDLIAGHIPCFVAVISTGIPPVQSGRARAIAVTGEKRAAAVPNVPTIAESGVKGYAAVNWYGLLAPAKTPAAVIARLNKELVAALNSPEVVQQLKDRGIDAAPSSPEEFTNFIHAEEKKWVSLIKRLDIKE